jgi:hypothetical protein
MEDFKEVENVQTANDFQIDPGKFVKIEKDSILRDDYKLG